MTDWINAKDKNPPLRVDSEVISIDVMVKVGTQEGRGVYNHRKKFWSTSPPLNPNRVSFWRELSQEELLSTVPEDSIKSRAIKMREDFIKQVEFMGGAATLDQLIDVLGLIIDLSDEA